jgi:hypothetical protein
VTRNAVKKDGKNARRHSLTAFRNSLALGEPYIMNTKKMLAVLIVAIGTGATVAAYAWSIQEDRNTTVLIECEDGSTSTVGKANGGWTVLSPGKKGVVGGQFDIVGQAALAGCGEQ